ncbi:MAG: hypothetical protein HYY29_05970 [Chloroflexi bacterium]|nr:hypothetical protein [Chloroflexota bacterium]
MTLKKAIHLKMAGCFQLDMPAPFDFALTVAKPAGWHWSAPREVFDNGVLWSGIYLDDKPVGLKMTAEDRTVSAAVYARSGLNPPELARAKDEIDYALGRDVDLRGFYRFAARDELLSRVVKDLHGMRTGWLNDIFGRVILAICLQMAPLARSQKMMDNILEHYGTGLFFDGREVVLWPRAGDIGALDPEQLKKTANLGYRAGRLVQAARYVMDHPMTRRQLADLPEGQALKAAMAIPGIGEYSAGIILGRGSVTLDVWSVVIMSELVLKRTPQNPRGEVNALTAELNRRWGQWAWLAFAYIVNDLETLAKAYPLSRIH